MVSQKLIVSAIALAIYGVLFFVFDKLYNSLGGIDPNTLQLLTVEGWVRGLLFWGTEISLVIGSILFAVGVVEVLFVLREIRVRRDLN